MADYTIRSMKLDDIETVVGIQETIIKKKVAARWQKALEHYIDKDPKSCLVAVIKRKTKDIIIGFIVGEIKIWGFGLRQSGWVEIIGIDPTYMGIGVGHALGKRLLNYFKRMKVDGIYTAVRWDSGDLLSFFKSLGFEHSGFLNLEYTAKKEK
ncbi:MAG: GNAT family N-acetyltransferase [Thermoplasmata archaeon]|nr:GNAT family N-acetyltransferase [Thermoplasmata archaeon]